MKYQLVELFGKWTVAKKSGDVLFFYSFLYNLFLSKKDYLAYPDLTDKPTAENKLKELEDEK